MKNLCMALAAMALISCSCSVNIGGNGKHVVCKGPVVLKQLDVDMNLTDFNSIRINGSADLKYVQDKEGFGVQVEANEEVFQYLNYYVEDGTLVLETKDNVEIRAKKYGVYVASPTLVNVEVNGALDATIIAIKQEEDLTIVVNGASDCELENIHVPTLTFTINGASDLDVIGLDVENLCVNVNGAGDVDLAGKAGKASLNVAGAGDIDARNLECSNIDKSQSGLASIRTRR